MVKNEKCRDLTFFFNSDLTIHLEGDEKLFGHRFVLAARSDFWGVEDLSKVSELNFTGKWQLTLSRTTHFGLLNFERVCRHFKFDENG